MLMLSLKTLQFLPAIWFVSGPTYSIPYTYICTTLNPSCGQSFNSTYNWKQHCQRRRKTGFSICSYSADQNQATWCMSALLWLAGWLCAEVCLCMRACVRVYVSSNHHCHSPVKGNILREIRLIVLAFKSKTYCAFQWMRGHKLFSHTLCSLLCLVIQQASRTRWQSWAAWVWEIKEIAPSLLLLAPF